MDITRNTLRTAVAMATEEIATVPGISEETAIIVDLIGMSIGAKLEQNFFGKENGNDLGRTDLK